MQWRLRFSNGNSKNVSMRKAKWLIAGFLLVLCFFFGIALLLPSKVTVSKSIIINAPPLAVAGQIRDFNKWKNWYPALQDKEVSVINLENQKGSLPHSMELRDSKGHSIIYKMIQSSNDTTKIDLQTNHTNYQFITLPNDKQHTLLIWNINTTLGWYPWERIQGVIMDKIAGPAYIPTLQNLKETVENYAQGSLTK